MRLAQTAPQNAPCRAFALTRRSWDCLFTRPGGDLPSLLRPRPLDFSRGGTHSSLRCSSPRWLKCRWPELLGCQLPLAPDSGPAALSGSGPGPGPGPNASCKTATQGRARGFGDLNSGTGGCLFMQLDFCLHPGREGLTRTPNWFTVSICFQTCSLARGNKSQAGY